MAGKEDKMRKYITKAEERMNKTQIRKLITNGFVNHNPEYHNKATLLDILNYERLTPKDFITLGRNPDGTL
jgi:hypothetical protein